MKNLTRNLVVFASLVSFTSEAAYTTSRRGKVSEYDPGPKKDSLWVPLFGAVPNYRAIGKEYTGEEKFRWNIGPMWYRGRLGENQVKVLVVGQEGAQDENTSNRTFTGGTGTKTQNMLDALEMDRSYVFLNTFVYTIFGQRDAEVKEYMDMEQGADSPIVKYRHQLFDYTAQYNSKVLSMMVAVGGGAKESLVNWIESRGGKCPNGNPNACDTTDMVIYKQAFGDKQGKIESVVEGVYYTDEAVKLANKTLVIHVPHPGMARFEGGGDAVAKGFSSAAKRIQDFIAKNPKWLNGSVKPDTGSTNDIVSNLNKFVYKNTPAPHRDFAFATTWRLGDGGTNTVRDGQDAIAIWADGGEYGSTGRHDKKVLGDDRNRNGSRENAGRPWEPVRKDQAQMYDYGPCGYVDVGDTCPVAEAMMSWPDFTKIKPAVSQHESFGFGPSYRGNTLSPSLIILADQESHDDFFTARALTGEIGQRLQTYLSENGYSNSDSSSDNDYVIVRTLPVDTLGMSDSDRTKVALDPKVVTARNKIISLIAANSKKAKKELKAWALGSTAEEAAKKFTGLSFESFPVDTLPKKLTDIDMADLPYSTRYFMGKSGNRATTDNGMFYRFQAPSWVKKTPIPRD